MCKSSRDASQTLTVILAVKAGFSKNGVRRVEYMSATLSGFMQNTNNATNALLRTLSVIVLCF